MPSYGCTKGGKCETTGPLDICNVQSGPVVVPTPYSNSGEWLMAIGNPVALFDGMPSCTILDMIMLSTGDESGTLMGVASGMIIGMVTAEIGCPVVMVGGAMVASFGVSTTIQNLTNAVGLYSSASQSIVTGA